MKKRIYKLTAIILALLILVSCAVQGAVDDSSALSKNENQGMISSASPEQPSSLPASSDKQDAQDKKPKKEWTLGKAYIPKDNPAPVTLDRQDAATPTPISFTDKKVKNDMKLEVKLKELHSTELEECGRHISIINSRAELMEIWEKDEKSNYDIQKNYYENHSNYAFDENKYYINWYSEEFFNNNALVMIFFTRGSGAYRCKIDYVASENDRMYIYVNNVDLPNDAVVTCDMLYPRLFIAIPKKEMENIKDIVVYSDEY